MEKKEIFKDGVVAVTIQAPVFLDADPQSLIERSTIEEQILAETQYQTMLLELNTTGGV